MTHACRVSFSIYSKLIYAEFFHITKHLFTSKRLVDIHKCML